MRKFFSTNELVINLKKGQTESTLFSTSQKLAKYGKELKLQYDGTYIQQTDSYKYLGTVLNSTFSLNWTVNLNLTANQENKLKSIDKLTTNILGKKQTKTKNEILKHKYASQLSTY